MSVSENRLEEVIKLVAEAVSRELDTVITSSISSPSILVEVSNRHCHLTKSTFEALYGKGRELTPIRWLSQPGEFAAQETVAVVGPGMRALERVRIVGPFREHDQVELSFTDAFYLGFEDLPTRLSGDIADTPSITLIGPRSAVTLKEGAIRAARHLHMLPEDAEKWGMRNGERVDIELPGVNGLILRGVIVRVSPRSKLACHIDTDEANAAGVKGTTFGRIVRCSWT